MCSKVIQTPSGIAGATRDTPRKPRFILRAQAGTMPPRMQTRPRLPPHAGARPGGQAAPAVISQRAEVTCARPDPSVVCSSP